MTFVYFINLIHHEKQNIAENEDEATKSAKWVL